MEQIWVIPNLIALTGTIVVLIWQSIHDKDYARKQHENCEEKLERAYREISSLQIEVEKLNLLLMGKGGIVIHGSRVGVNRDMIGGDSVVREDVTIDKTK